MAALLALDCFGGYFCVFLLLWGCGGATDVSFYCCKDEAMAALLGLDCFGD